MSKHKNANLFDQEKREKLLPSRQILMNFDIQEGQIIADLGCGYGHFALRAAEIVGPVGKIKAIDIEMERMAILRERAKEQGLDDRIETIITSGENIPLPNGNVHIALAANILHELDDPLEYLREIRRILQPDGKLWVVEWVKVETEIGPPLAERRTIQEWADLLKKAGFVNIWFQHFSPTHVLISATHTKE